MFELLIEIGLLIGFSFLVIKLIRYFKHVRENKTADTKIIGDVNKLTSIGVVKGDVLIINNDAIKDTLLKLAKKTSILAKDASQKLPKRTPILASTISDITDYINVYIKSVRFGRKVKFKVPHDMTMRAFIKLVVHVLKLPNTLTFKRMGVSFRVTYSILYDDNLFEPSGKSLRSLEISNENDLMLHHKIVACEKSVHVGYGGSFETRQIPDIDLGLHHPSARSSGNDSSYELRSIFHSIPSSHSGKRYRIKQIPTAAKQLEPEAELRLHHRLEQVDKLGEHEKNV